MSYHPQVEWAQRKDKVYLTVVLLAARDVKVNVNPEGVFTFSAIAGAENHRYELKLDLFGKVNAEESKHIVSVRSVFCVIGKAEKGWWKNLLRGGSEKTPPHYLELDWEKWVDEDEADETPEVSTEDFLPLDGMGGMGGSTDMASLVQEGTGGGMDGKGDERIKRCPRPYLTPEILYNEDRWIDWALCAYNLEDLIEMRNEGGHFMFIHVAGIEALGFGFIIRDYHGTPIYAYSESISDENEPVSEFYLEVKAAEVSLELAKQLDFKYVSMVSTSVAVATIVRSCYCEEIARELRFRRNSNHICFRIHPEPAKRSLNPAVCLAGLAASERKSKLAISFDQGLEKMPVAKDKLDKLLKLLYTEASSESLFHP